MWNSLLLLLASVTVIRAAEPDSEAGCRAHLKLIGGAIRAYRLVHENKSPAKLADLYLEGLVENLGDFTCPTSSALIQTSAELETKSDYTFEPVPGSANLLAREKTPHHGTNTVLAVFADGTSRSRRALPRRRTRRAAVVLPCGRA